MCTDLTLESDINAGLVLGLCEHAATHLVELFRLDPRTAAAQVFQILARPQSFAVIEWVYFDLDYRSEFTVTHETSFPVRDPNASRINFFSSPAPTQPLSLYDAVVNGRPHYRGYCVIRPQVVGAIGRTMVTTDADLTQPEDRVFSGLRENAVLSDFIRTAVVEDVEVFGVGLRIVGTPFMEQDQHLLRCAHISAWICHYTAVLRGLVPRRPTAQFHLAEDATGAYGRSYPSYGLSSWSLSRVLRQLDLPPEILTQGDLLKPG